MKGKVLNVSLKHSGVQLGFEDETGNKVEKWFTLNEKAYNYLKENNIWKGDDVVFEIDRESNKVSYIRKYTPSKAEIKQEELEDFLNADKIIEEDVKEIHKEDKQKLINVWAAMKIASTLISTYYKFTTEAEMLKKLRELTIEVRNMAEELAYYE